MVQSVLSRQRKSALRMRSGNPVFCLCCYLIAFAVPVLWQYAALAHVYPWKLAATAPDFAAHLCAAFPFLSQQLAPVAALTAEGSAALREVMAMREEVWLFSLAFLAFIAWAATLVLQLLWRFTNRSPLFSSQQTNRAVRRCHFMLVCVWGLNLLIAAFLWLFGVQHIIGRTLWDYAVCFGVFALNPLAAWIVSRLAASPAISCRHGYFKRI